MASTSSSSTRSRRSRSSRNSRTAGRSSSACSSGCGTWGRPLSCSQKPHRKRRTSDSRLRNRGATRRTSQTESLSSRCTRSRTSRFSAESGSRRCGARTTRRDSPPSCSTRGASKSYRSSVPRWSMPNSIPCPSCASPNRVDAVNCRTCGRKLGTPRGSTPTDPPLALQRVTSGQVFTAVVAEPARKPSNDRAASVAAPPVAVTTGEPEVEDHSDVMAAAVDGIRAKAQGEGHRFKPYVRSSDRKAPTPAAKQEAANHLQDAVALLRETRFEDSIDPLLKAIARDDEDRRSWILLAEAYLRLGRPYKSAVGYLRALELSPKDEQAWLGLGRVLRMLGDVQTASAVLDRAAVIHPGHAETWVERGLIFESLQNLPEAARSFAKVLELRPDHRLAQEKSQEIGSKVDGPDCGRGAGTRHPRRDGRGVLHRDVVDRKATRRSGSHGSTGRAPRARAHLRRRAGPDAGRGSPLGPRRPHRRCSGDHEVLPRILDPPAERGAGGLALSVLEPRRTRVEPPEADGLSRPPLRGLERIARGPRSEDGHEPPRREEGLARGPPTRHSVGQGSARARRDRNRLARSPGGLGEVQGPPARDLPAVRVAPRPRDHQLPRHGTAGLGRRGTCAPGPPRRGIPRGRRDPSADAHGDGFDRPAPPPRREDARDEARHGVSRDGLRRGPVPRHPRDEFLRGTDGPTPRQDPYPRLR